MAKQYKALQGFFIFALAITLIVVTTFRSVGIDSDSLSYLDAYNAFRLGSITIVEPTFNIFALIANLLFGGGGLIFVFFLYAIFAIPIKFYAIYKYSNSAFISIIVYLCIFYILHDFTQIRVGVAAAFYLLAIPDLINGNIKGYLIKIVLASLFHLSAIILFPLYLLSNKTINYKVVFYAPLLTLCAVLLLGDVSSLLISLFSYLPSIIADKAIAYIYGVQLYEHFDKVNVFSKITISSYIIFSIYFFSVVRQKNVTSNDIIYLKLFSIMLCVFYILSSVPVLASRSFELFSVSFIFSFPEFITKIKPRIIPGVIIFTWLLVYFFVVNLKLIGS